MFGMRWLWGNGVVRVWGVWDAVVMGERGGEGMGCLGCSGCGGTGC